MQWQMRDKNHTTQTEATFILLLLKANCYGLKMRQARPKKHCLLLLGYLPPDQSYHLYKLFEQGQTTVANYFEVYQSSSRAALLHKSKSDRTPVTGRGGLDQSLSCDPKQIIANKKPKENYIVHQKYKSEKNALFSLFSLQEII